MIKLGEASHFARKVEFAPDLVIDDFRQVNNVAHIETIDDPFRYVDHMGRLPWICQIAKWARIQKDVLHSG